MSFEIKYNKNGEAVVDQELHTKFKAEAAKAMEDVAAASESLQPPTEAASTSSSAEAPADMEAISSDPAPSEEEYNRAEQEEKKYQSKSREDNLRALREKSERMERERDEYMRKLQEVEAKKQEIDDTDFNLGDADLAEGKHLKKLQQEIKRLRQESESNKQQSHVTQAEIRLKSQYPDFDKVVSQSNIASLREEYPELAATINSNNDIYTKAVSAYTMIKKLGIHQEPIYTADKARIAQNANKPKPSATIAPQKSDSPLSQANAFANGLTPALKEQLRTEMESSRRGY